MELTFSSWEDNYALGFDSGDFRKSCFKKKGINANFCFNKRNGDGDRVLPNHFKKEEFQNRIEALRNEKFKWIDLNHKLFINSLPNQSSSTGIFIERTYFY